MEAGMQFGSDDGGAFVILSSMDPGAIPAHPAISVWRACAHIRTTVPGEMAPGQEKPVMVEKIRVQRDGGTPVLMSYKNLEVCFTKAVPARAG